MAERSIPKLVAVATTGIVFMLMVIFNILSAKGTPGLFNHTARELSKHYELEISPAPWTFLIYLVIFAWQALWIGYAFSTICRKCASGPLYLHPAQMSIWFYLLFIFACICNIIWAIVRDRYRAVAALVFVAMIPLTLNVCLVLAMRSLSQNKDSLIKEGLVREVWMIHIFVENGILIYLAFTEVATLLNSGIVMHYVLGIDKELACTVVLALLTVIFISWFILDIFVPLLDQYTRYWFIYYPVIVVALSGIISKNWDSSRRNQIFTAVLLVLACVATVVKMILMVYRHKTRPTTLSQKHSLITTATPQTPSGTTHGGKQE